ncbi:NADPH oxidase 1 isoform X1 [Strix uralensis]|uniref:NADPH oxidase 1 isoform X1 n=1 Tax=Strix uralensis TaxID=36305 RepID=UPI003DA37AA5
MGSALPSWKVSFETAQHFLKGFSGESPCSAVPAARAGAPPAASIKRRAGSGRQQQAGAGSGRQARGRCTMGNWLVNHWFSAAVLAAWLGINIFLFTYYFLFFDRDERYFYTRAILGVRCPSAAPCLSLGALLQWGGGCSTPFPLLVLPSSSLLSPHPNSQLSIAPCLSILVPDLSQPNINPSQSPAQSSITPSQSPVLLVPILSQSRHSTMLGRAVGVSMAAGRRTPSVTHGSGVHPPSSPQSALAWARASAKCLNFNSMLILLPVCRNLLSFLRGTCLCCRRTLRKQLDHNLTFHKLVAYMLALLTAVHTIAHLFNLERYNHSQQATDRSLPAVLSKMHLQGSNKWLNPIHSNQTTVEYVAFTTIPGLTGVIITLALILMVTSSTEFIRRNYFEVFWYTHHLFLIYFAGLVIHGIAGLVRGQTEESMEEVHPRRCAQYLTQKEEDCSHDCCKHPEFGSIPAESWKWVLAPVLLYIFERILRVWRAWQKVVVTKVVMHPARVLELQMQKKGFRMEVGQYIFVNCPTISLLEWHPFTLTSAPEEDFFSIHIRAAGDWTERLIDTFQQQNPEMPRIEVDGPFGTASEDVFQYEVAMLVGAGIGVTPFASILKSIWYKFQQADQTLKTKKIYFYWLCRDTGAFAWFNDLLASLEQKMAESGKADFLTYRLFLTGWDTSIANNVALRFDTATDTVTGLRHKTIFGRPMWNSEFAAVAAAHPRSVVGVFLCGPDALAKSLQKFCHQHSSLDPRKVKFYFNKENF